jgi:hypothetical protein
MVFKKRSELNGEIDKNINTNGRIKSDKTMSRRAIHERELISLMRKLKPHLTDAVNISTKVMKNDETTDGNKLKASALIMSFYKELLKDAYTGSDEEGEGTEVQPNKPMFSLTMVSDGKVIPN